VLARRLCLSARAEPALVRAARLSAGLEAAVESELWFGGLVASAGPLGIALDPGVADLLRDELDTAEREAAWALLAAHHAAEPWSIRLEERINYLTAGGAGAAEVEELLAAALDELHDTDERAALGIARWLLAALTRLPAAARATPAAAAASVAAGAHLDGRLGDLDALTDEQRETWLPKLLRGLGTTDLPVRLLPGALVLGGDPQGAPFVRVPQTDPLAVTVEWDDGHEAVRLRAGEQRRVATGRAATVRVRTVAGAVSEINPLAAGRLQWGDRQSAPACAVSETEVVTASDLVVERMRFVLDSGAAIRVADGPPFVAGELATLRLAGSVSAPPLARPNVGDRWRFADGRPGSGMVALDNGSEILIDTHGDFPIERGAAVVTDRPWGAVFGVMLGRTMQGFVRVAPLASNPASPETALRIAPASSFTLAELGLPIHAILGEAYVPRDVDAELDEALAQFPVVVVDGPSGSGRARVLWEALRRAEAMVAIPQTSDLERVLRELAGRGERVVVWLNYVTAEDLAPLEHGALPGEVRLAVVLDGPPRLPTYLAYHRVTLSATLSESETERAWQVFGPELALDPNDPWSGDGVAMHERAVDRARAEADPQRLAIALRAYGLHLLSRNRREEAVTVLEHSFELVEDTDVLVTLIDALGQSGRALGYAERLLRARRSQSDPLALAAALRLYAGAGLRAGSLEAATSAIAEAEALARSLAPDELASELAALARLWAGFGDERAIALAQECVDLRRRFGDAAQLALAQEQLVDVYERLGQQEQAFATLQERLASGPQRPDLTTRLDELRRASTIGSWNDYHVSLYPYAIELGDRTVPLAALSSITVVEGSFRKLPRVTLELWSGERVDFDIRAGSTVNFPANNRAAADFKSQVTARQRFT
jgi:tetratricopeptide (TPR) repeat protein